MKYIFKLSFLFCGIFLCSWIPSSAQTKPLQTFTLNDGTSIKGTLTGVRDSDGAYLIQTDTMGSVTVDAEKVLMISADQNPAPQISGSVSKQGETPQKISSSDVQQAQDILMSDPSISQAIQELMTDPDIVKLLQDPQIMQAVMTMDPATIQSNPKIQQLLQHPKMQQIIERSQQKLSGHALEP